MCLKNKYSPSEKQKKYTTAGFDKCELCWSGAFLGNPNWEGIFPTIKSSFRKPNIFHSLTMAPCLNHFFGTQTVMLLRDQMHYWIFIQLTVLLNAILDLIKYIIHAKDASVNIVFHSIQLDTPNLTRADVADINMRKIIIKIACITWERFRRGWSNIENIPQDNFPKSTSDEGASDAMTAVDGKFLCFLSLLN